VRALIVLCLIAIALYVVRDTLPPFIFALIIGYIAHPWVEPLKRYVRSRNVASLLITTGIMVGLLLLLLMLVPLIAAQLTQLLPKLPGMVTFLHTTLYERLLPWLSSLPADPLSLLKDHLMTHAAEWLKHSGAVASNVWSSGLGVVHTVSLWIITPVVCFYLIRDWPTMIQSLSACIPKKYLPTCTALATDIDSCLSGFLRGQCQVCLLLACYYALGLSIIGSEGGIVLGVMTGLLSFIPFVGAFLGLTMAMILSVVSQWALTPLFGIAIVFIGGQILEGYILTPRLVGNKIGLHPVWILFALFAGASVAGFVGVLVAVPMAAILGVVLRFIIASWHAPMLSKIKLPKVRL
jgi:predicted PurR-regulated permease PerM